MLGQPYVAPNPCSKCSHKLALGIESESSDAFESCFKHYLRAQDENNPTEPDVKMASSIESDFLQSLFLDMEQLSPDSASSGSSGNSSDGENHHHHHHHHNNNNKSNNNNNGYNSYNSPATELSPTSPPAKFSELDLDGFTPGVPTFPSNSIDKSDCGTAACPDYLNCKPQDTGSEAISPGKTLFHPTPAARQNPHLKQEPAAGAPQTRPNLSIYTPYQETQQSAMLASSASPMDTYSMIDPALTSLHGLHSATESAFSPTFSQAPSEAPVTGPRAGARNKASKSRKSSTISEDLSANETKTQPKRKRTRKTEPTSPADVEKQARFLERNRNAASRCRARRKAQNDRLEIRAGELERERDGLRLLHQSLMSEKAELMGRILDLGCEDSCDGTEGHGSMGSRACKPPRDLLISALNEMVMGSSDSQDMDEPVRQDDADMTAA